MDDQRTPASLSLRVHSRTSWAKRLADLCLRVPRRVSLRKSVIALLTGSLLIQGCASDPANLTYLGEPDHNYYRDMATQIDAPLVDSYSAGDAMATDSPRTVADRRKDEIREMALAEAIQVALQNNSVIRSDAQFLSPGNTILAGPNNAASVYDPAIQESGVLFGGRGVEAALSAFDAQLSTSMIWQRDEEVQNNAFFGGGLAPGSTGVNEFGNFETRLEKQTGYGATIGLAHSWLYRGTNAPGTLFPSSYDGLLQVEYRHPLLAGSGTEFTQVAGPISNSFGGLTGVTQGVVIARINGDISLTDFEANVRNLTRDVENVYWDLYLAYRSYDIAVVARNSTEQSWREVSTILEAGGGRFGEQQVRQEAELQARDQYYETVAAVKTALSNIYTTEDRLRRLLGLAVNDGTIIRPADEPPLAEFVPDWHTNLAEALTGRLELRRQKFNIKSLELQLRAAENLVRPRLDFVSNYRINGFGDQLLGRQDNDGATVQGLRSGYETLTQGDQTGWQLGFQLSMPFGFRSARAQVQNIELRLAKARDVLAAQELDISHELANSIQRLAEHYSTAEANFNRRIAAARRVELFEIERQEGTATLDLVLRAQRSRAAADSAYFASLVNYAKSIATYHYSKGSLLESNNVYLTESDWSPAAYQDALRRAAGRNYGIEHNLTDSEPEPFAVPADSIQPYAVPAYDALAQPVPSPITESDTPQKQPVETGPAPKADEKGGNEKPDAIKLPAPNPLPAGDVKPLTPAPHLDVPQLPDKTTTLEPRPNATATADSAEQSGSANDAPPVGNWTTAAEFRKRYGR